MRKYLDESEIKERIALNHKRLTEPYYAPDAVFKPAEYGWQGDFEGRALLAFVCSYSSTGEAIPCMDYLMSNISAKTNGRIYFGQKEDGIFDEQQLSGHSWYLRGLCEYYTHFGSSFAAEYAREVFESLYLPLAGKTDTYPTERGEHNGGVSGRKVCLLNGWRLSSDTGCLFMSLDGLSHYYTLFGDKRAYELVNELAVRLDGIDIVGLKMQTHCTLTAARGLLRMYEKLGDEIYLKRAKRIFSLYVNFGMTLTYQNFNWWGKGETWTEPCAIVDSLMLAHKLYKLTGQPEYRRYLSRIYFNGLSTAQRSNGGAGTDTNVTLSSPILKCRTYEAPFCCTMRLSEGLDYILKNRDEIWYEYDGEIHKDAQGRYFDNDLMYVQREERLRGEKTIKKDGIYLDPILKYYKLSNDDIISTEQRVVFL